MNNGFKNNMKSLRQTSWGYVPETQRQFSKEIGELKAKVDDEKKKENEKQNKRES